MSDPRLMTLLFLVGMFTLVLCLIGIIAWLEE